MREMSVIQPFSALNLFLFIECYQKEILNYFEAHHDFSIRYHKKSTDLYYKSRSGKVTQYFQNQSFRAGRSIIQQEVNLLGCNLIYSFLSRSTPLTFSSIFFIIKQQANCLQCGDAHTSSAQCENWPSQGQTLCLEHSCGKCSGTARETLPFRHLITDLNLNQVISFQCAIPSSFAMCINMLYSNLFA